MEYTYLDRKIQKNVLYYYQLKMINLDGSFEYSDIRSAIIKDSSFEVSVYPNPTNDVLHISIGNAFENGLIQMYNNNGKLVWERKPDQEVQDYTLHLEQWPKGIYLLRLTAAEKVIIKKVVVQ